MKYNFIIIIIALLVITGCSFSLSEDVTPPPDYVSPTPLPDIGSLYPEVPPAPARGKAFFYENCARCHGDTGLGNGIMSTLLPVAVPAIGLSEISRQVSPAEWYSVISRGNIVRGMPPFYDYSEEIRWDVLAYVYLLSSSPGELLSGVEIFKTHCSECHGLSGDENPKVDFTDQEYMSQTTNLSLYRSISEGKGDMKSFSGELEENEIWSVTDYLRSLSFNMTKLDPTQTSTPESKLTITPTIDLTRESTESISPESTSMTESPVTDTIIHEVYEIIGNVTNMTGTDLKGDLTAVLVYYNTIDKQVMNSQSTAIKTDGTFTFYDLEISPETSLWVTVDYQGVTYYSEIFTFEDSLYSLTIPVQVYDAITDWTKLQFKIIHITMEFLADLVNVSEIYIFTNNGFSTVTIETDGKSLPFLILPDGITELTGLSPDSRGASFLPYKNGIAIPPSIDNQYGVVASFSIPYNRRLNFSQEFPMTINTISLIAPEKVKVKSDQLQNVGTQEFNGVQYQLLENVNFLSGKLSFTITGTNGENNLMSITRQSWVMYTLGALGVVILGMGIYLFYRNRIIIKKEETEVEINPINGVSSDESLDNILDAIIELDEDFENGKISKEVHQEQRGKLISKIK